MKWEQIETKWAAMTRRIRADYTANLIGPTGQSSRGGDVLSATIAESMTVSAQEPEFKSSAK